MQDRERRHDIDLGEDRSCHPLLLAVVSHEREVENASKSYTRRIRVSQLPGTFDEGIDESRRGEFADLEVTRSTEVLGRGRALQSDSVVIRRAVEKQRLAMRSVADDQAQVAGSKEVDLDLSRENVECATRIYDERARHLGSCRAQVTGGKVDRELRSVIEADLPVLLEDSSCLGNVGIQVLGELTFTQ